MRHRRRVHRVLPFVVGLIGVAAPVQAQDRSRVDLEAGIGFSVTGDPAPSLPTGSVGVAFWLSRAWGVSFTGVTSFGEDRYDPPIEIPDRFYIGQDDLRYVRVSLRYRRAIGARTMLVLGAGAVTNASYEVILLLKTAGGGTRRIDFRNQWGGLGGEMYLDRHLGRHLRVRGGITFDTSAETSVFQPVVLGVVAFEPQPAH